MASHLGIDVRSLSQSNLIALLDQGIVSFAGFVTTVLIGRFASQHELGVYTLGLSVLLIAIEVQTALVATPFMVFSPRADADALAQYSGSSLTIQLGLAFLTSVLIAILGGTLLVSKTAVNVAPAILLLSLVALPILLRDYVRRVCFARLRIKTAVIFDALIVVLQIGGLLVITSVGLLSAAWSFLISGASCAIVAVAWLFSNRRDFEFRAAQIAADFAKNWNFGKWVLASAVLWVIGMSLYPWLLTAFHGTEAAGIWGACLGILAIGTIPMIGIQNLLGPRIATVYAAEGNAALRAYSIKAAATFAVVLTPVAFVLAIFGEWLLTTIYSSKYSGNGPVVTVLAINLVVSAVAFCFSRTLFVRERADLDCWINVIPLVILLTLGVWLTSAIGSLGAAISLLLANGVSAATRYAAISAVFRTASGAT